MPVHNHLLSASAASATSQTANGLVPATTSDALGANVQSYAAFDGSANLAPMACMTAGASQPVNIRNPYLGLQYCIAMNGVFPSRG